VTRLDEIEARANAATEGPWEVSVDHYAPIVLGPPAGDDRLMVAGDVLTNDAEFIAHARQDVPALVAALRAVLEVHEETPYGCAVCEEQNWALPWPCPTVAAIRQHIGEDA